jgi:hypothetical protein
MTQLNYRRENHEKEEHQFVVKFKSKKAALETAKAFIALGKVLKAEEEGKIRIKQPERLKPL